MTRPHARTLLAAITYAAITCAALALILGRP